MFSEHSQRAFSEPLGPRLERQSSLSAHIMKTPIIAIASILCFSTPYVVESFTSSTLGKYRNTLNTIQPSHFNTENRIHTIRTSRTFILHSGTSESAGDVNAYPDSRRKIAELKIKVDANLSKDVMNVAMLKESVRDMEQESSQPGFWDSQEKAQDLLTEMNRVKALVERVEYWQSSCEDVEVLLDMAAEDPEGAGE